MNLYKIRNWDELFENNRSRKVADLAWVPIPNRHDGENFTSIVTSKDGAIIFSAWVLLVQVASRCHPRGTLVRDGGRPHDPASLSMKTRAPREWFEKGLKFLSEHTDWLEIETLTQERQATATQVAPACQSGDEERTEQKEGNRKKEQKGTPSLEEVRLCCLKAGLPDSDAVWFFNKCEGNGWTINGKPIKSWPHVIASWKAAGYMASQKNEKRLVQPRKPLDSVPFQ